MLLRIRSEMSGPDLGHAGTREASDAHGVLVQLVASNDETRPGPTAYLPTRARCIERYSHIVCCLSP